MPNVAATDNSPDFVPEWIKPRRSLDGFCWNDYERWGEDVRVEMLDGLVYMMGAPDEWHQWVVGSMYRQLGNFLDGKKCTPYIAPFDVRLFPKEDGSDVNLTCLWYVTGIKCLAENIATALRIL